MSKQSLDFTPLPEGYEQIIEAIKELNRDMEELRILIYSESNLDTGKKILLIL